MMSHVYIYTFEAEYTVYRDIGKRAAPEEMLMTTPLFHSGVRLHSIIAHHMAFRKVSRSEGER